MLPAACNGEEKCAGCYFEDITVEQVESDEEGWNRIENRLMLWK